MAQLAAHERSLGRWEGILAYYERQEMRVLAKQARATIASLRVAKLELLRTAS